MKLFGKKAQYDREIKESENLVKQREKILMAWPEVEERWNRANQENVELLASRLVILREMKDPQGYLDAQEQLKRAIWARDREKQALQSEVERLAGELEVITLPVIHEKATAWQNAITELKGKKIVQKLDSRETLDAGLRITVSSNLLIIREAKEKLIESIKKLRSMRLSCLADILQFVERTEKELGEIDFTKLRKHEGEITQEQYEDLSVHAETAKEAPALYLVGHQGEKIVPTSPLERKKRSLLSTNLT